MKKSGCVEETRILYTQQLDQNSGTGSRLCLLHYMFDVLFDCLFCNAQSVADFFIRPTLEKMLHDSSFALGQMEALFALLKDGVLLSPDNFDGHEPLRFPWVLWLLEPDSR